MQKLPGWKGVMNGKCLRSPVGRRWQLSSTWGTEGRKKVLLTMNLNAGLMGPMPILLCVLDSLNYEEAVLSVTLGWYLLYLLKIMHVDNYLWPFLQLHSNWMHWVWIWEKTLTMFTISYVDKVHQYLIKDYYDLPEWQKFYWLGTLLFSAFMFVVSAITL